ncbi:MAG: hypothetical protein Q7R95_11495, partial [bacterium]|nr:hypothetical protein [bacterium]
YNFKRHSFKMYHSEKNRLMILLENYELKTLLILSPILIMNELLLIIYSIISGWFRSKMKSYNYIISHYLLIIRRRKIIQKNRITSDKEIWKQFESELNFEGMNKTLQNLINPFYKGYYYFVSIFINL